MDRPTEEQRVNEEVEDDLWGRDDDLGHYSQSDTDLEREWEARRNHFYTFGYRDGISAGKESEAQVGFNLGFKQAVVAGYNWGVARGAASAFAALTLSFKELLLKDQDVTKRLENLNTSISSTSSDEALRLYYEESILPKGPAVPEEGAQTIAIAVDTNHPVVNPESENKPSGCCDGRGDCNLQGLSLEPGTDDQPTRCSETCEAGPCSNSSSSSVGSLLTDEDISDIGYGDEFRSTRPNVSIAAEAETSIGSSSSRSTRLELLQGEVEKEFEYSIVKLTPFPQ